MQDSHFAISPFPSNSIDSRMSLFGVFDGHGGAEVAIFAERNFPKELIKNQNFQKGFYQQALKETTMKMDELLRTTKGRRQVKHISKEMVEKENEFTNQAEAPETNGGCTANICLVTPDYIYVANVGDSRAVASIKSIEKELSFDHKPHNALQEKRIKKAGGEIHCGRVNGHLNLSRAIGDLIYKENKELGPAQQLISSQPDIIKIPNQGLDYIIMGCDGIWETKSPSQMIEWVTSRLSKGHTLQGALQQLFDELVARDISQGIGCDNMSAILIRFPDKRTAWIRNRKRYIEEIL